MAKRSVAYKSDRGQIPNTADYKGDFQGSTQPKSKLSGGFGPFGIKYSKPIGPVKPVGQRMDEYSRQQLAKLKQKAAAPVPKPKPKPPQVIRTTVSERVTPANAPATAPARMAVNRATGDTTGFTSGKTTGSTVTKAGVATKTGGTAFQQMQRNAMAKRGEAGPRKDSSGRNVSSMTGNRTATSSASRSTGGASRSSRGGMEKFGPGTGSKR
jgi:hypothetical protein